MRAYTLSDVLDTCHDTIWAIAASPLCSEFVVGYTHRSGRARQLQYYGAEKFGYQHLVVVADRLNQNEALWLEEELQNLIKANAEGIGEFEKYRASNRADVSRRSSGGQTLADDQRICSVYMAWLEAGGT